MKKWVWWFGLTILAILLSFVQWRYPLPTGTVIIQVVGVVVIVMALGLNLLQSYLTMLVVAITLILLNFHNWLTVVPIIIGLLVVSLILRWQTPLSIHMNHTQAINFGLIAGFCQLLGMLLVIFIQALVVTSKWNDFTLILEMGLPAALLNGLLDCLLVPPLTLWLRHYTEQVD
ncbi:hypothetical protein [uncultured Limosilactobacillus sp.]|uniref:hypothetical protein n=1 Tax=uncultured Limosilactobacillus sp. TaxID=2837629 RepID=UPI0025FAA051|nr:hypothetical protein [uncultured Limosilactobacillus sp.]